MMHKLFLGLIIIVLFIFSCSKKEKNIESKNSQKQDFIYKGKSTFSIESRKTLNVQDAFSKIKVALAANDTVGLSNLVDSNVSCGLGSEGGKINCLTEIALFRNSDTGSLFRKKINELANSGLSVRLVDGDTVGVFPSYFPFGIQSPCDQESNENCFYLPTKEIKLFAAKDISSENKIIQGNTYVSVSGAEGCKSYSFYSKETECEWQSIKTMNGESGWVRNGAAKWIYEFGLVIKKKNDEWLITMISTGAG